MKRRTFLATGAALAATAALPVAAADWQPRRPINLVVPYPAGRRHQHLWPGADRSVVGEARRAGQHREQAGRGRLSMARRKWPRRGPMARP